jgi:hypothetical protein
MPPGRTDASFTTEKKRVRTLAVNEYSRLRNKINGINVVSPPTSGGQAFDVNGTSYNEWKNYLKISNTFITQTELDVLYPGNPKPTFS